MSLILQARDTGLFNLDNSSSYNLPDRIRPNMPKYDYYYGYQFHNEKDPGTFDWYLENFEENI